MLSIGGAGRLQEDLLLGWIGVSTFSRLERGEAELGID